MTVPLLTTALLLPPDTLANRPSYTTLPRGALFAATDNGTIYRVKDDGSGWATWLAPGAGGGIPSTLIDAKGDLIVGASDNTAARLAAGADGGVVMFDSAQTNGVKSRALDESDVAPVAPNAQTGTTYTMVLADGRRLVTLSNTSAITLTIPTNATAAFPVGTVLTWVQLNTGQVTVQGASGVVLDQAHGLKTSARYALVTATKIGTDEWLVAGDTTT